MLLLFPVFPLFPPQILDGSLSTKLSSPLQLTLLLDKLFYFFKIVQLFLKLQKCHNGEMLAKAWKMLGDILILPSTVVLTIA